MQKVAPLEKPNNSSALAEVSVAIETTLAPVANASASLSAVKSENVSAAAASLSGASQRLAGSRDSISDITATTARVIQ